MKMGMHCKQNRKKEQLPQVSRASCFLALMTLMGEQHNYTITIPNQSTIEYALASLEAEKHQHNFIH